MLEAHTDEATLREMREPCERFKKTQQQFLLFVAQGNCRDVKTMLIADEANMQRMLLSSGKLTDSLGRTVNCTAYD